jgi:pyridoxal biosynthesis lyase PdxS
MADTGTWKTKTSLVKMRKGGVIMDEELLAARGR